MAMDPFEPHDGGHDAPGPSDTPPRASGPRQPQVPYPTPGPRAAYPEESKAVVSLVLSILGLVVCGVLSPVAWYYGREEIKAIDAGRRDPSKRDLATAGKIIGMIGTAFISFILAAVALFVIIAFVSTVAGA